VSSDPTLPHILLLLLLLIFYALCTACETALDSINESSRSRLAQRTDKRAILLFKLVTDPEWFQSGLHLAALAAETVWFLFGLSLLSPQFNLPHPGQWAVSGVILACLLWLFGRSIPRRTALSMPLQIGLALCPFFNVLVTVLTPITALFVLLSKGILRLLGVRPDDDPDVSVEEIRAMMDMGQEAGTIEADEKEMIENIFDFNSITAQDVMIHRTDMDLVSLEDSTEDIIALIEESGRSRFPVFGEDSDDIVGILNTRDFLLNLQRKDPKPLAELVRPAYFIPESVPADDLFHDMQARAVQMAIVVDEYGGTGGLVTLEDLLEELVGNIYDEFDQKAEQEIFPLEENLWRVSGSASLESLAEALDLPLPEEELPETLGGLVFSSLSVIPEDGTTPVVDAWGLHIQVELISDRRVEQALVSKLPEAVEE
jgi:putative hemolysin